MALGAGSRLEKLGIPHIFLNVKDKIQLLEEFLTGTETGLDRNPVYGR